MMADLILTYIIEYPGTNLIKVGQAKYFVDRFAQLKTGSPVAPIVVCCFRGAEHEKAIHNKFEHLRHHGEFYHYTRELRQYIYSPEHDEYRLTRAQAEEMSPRIVRTRERLRAEQKAPDAAKAAELETSLETDEKA